MTVLFIKRQGGKKRLKRKAYVVYSVEHFFFEPLGVSPVRLNTAKAGVGNVLTCDLRCRAA